MKTLLALGIVGLMTTASAGTPVTPENVYGQPSVKVFEAHDRFPGNGRKHGIFEDNQAGGEDECHENHKLKPDGDNDCDDPGGVGFSVPVDNGSLGANLALALGAGGAGFFAKRRRKV